MGNDNELNNYESDDELERSKLKELSKEELVDKLIKLSESKSAQEEFILNISHDLRSPLSIILSILQCYKNEYTSNEGRENVKKHTDIIKRNCYKMLKLINNLIDSTKLEKDYYKLRRENLDIINLIEWNIASMDKYAQQKNISLVFDTNVEECVMAIDGEAIDRIVMNLVSNAIKFSNEGSSIYINAWKNENTISVSVRDEGMGIPKEEQKTIFNRFVQSSKNKKSEYCGSGIGLDLVQHLVKAHGGEITLMSEENKGSEFTFKLPIEVLDEDNNKNKNIKNLEVKNKVDILEVEFSDIYL